MRRPANRKRTERSRHLRDSQTKAESLIWTAVRAKRLGGLRFRRQHPIGPFFADFACVAHRQIIELDGDYHEFQPKKDAARQRYLEQRGWRVLRFRNEDVIDDTEAVVRAVARQLGIKVP